MTRYALLSKLMRKDIGQSDGWDAEYEKEAMGIPKRFSLYASVLQLMRKQIRIPMPEFYDKFFPDRKDCYVKNVNLNRYLKGNPKKYVSPGLGNACFAFNALSEEDEFRDLLSSYGISDGNREILINLWQCISEIRNREAHCQTITGEQYHEIRCAVNDVMKDYLPLFIQIKRDLRG